MTAAISATMTDDDATVIRLAASLDLTAAEPLHRVLLERAAVADSVTIDAGAADRVSTAVLQVLLAAATDARARGTKFAFRNASPAFAGAIGDLGLAAHFTV